MDSLARRPLALVTGASRGIGAALARELGRHGHDLVLSARTIEPMRELAAELRRVGVEATEILADLSMPGAAALLADEIDRRGLSIDVLINNAGLGGLGRFDRIEPARVAEMLQVNIVALTELTRLLLPGMIARRHGRIMLVGSVAGFSPGPGMAVYFATKAYVLSSARRSRTSCAAPESRSRRCAPARRRPISLTWRARRGSFWRGVAVI